MEAELVTADFETSSAQMMMAHLELSREHFTGQEGPDSSNCRHDRRRDKKYPVEHSLSATDLASEYLQIEGQGESDAYGEAQKGSQKRHDPVK